MNPSVSWRVRRTRVLGARVRAAFAILLLPSLADAQQSGSLSGVVRNAATQLPIADAVILVRASARGTQSDESGHYVIAGVPHGSSIVVVQRLGYASRTDTVQIDAGRVARLDVSLHSAAQVIAPLIVSATREAQRRNDASATIDVLDGVSLREARASHPAGIAQRIPGVHVSQLSGEGHSTAIRQPISTKPLYLYLEDGVPTRSTGFFNHNALYEVNLPQSGGMEVLKGPGTALYGSDAIGGVINVLTRPAPATPSAELSLEGGDYGYRRLLATGGFTSGLHGLRLDVNRTSADGFKDDAPYKRYSGTIRHDLTTTQGWAFRTVVTGTSVEQRDVFALSGAQFVDRPALNRSPIAFRDVSALRWSTAAELEVGSSLLSVTPYARHNVLKLLPNWQLTFNPEVWDTRNDSYGMLVKYRRDFAPLRTRVIAGADFDLSPGSVVYNGIATAKSGADSAWTSYTVGATHYDYDVTYRQASPYIHAEFSPVKRARIDAGLRYDHSGYSYDSRLPEVQTGRFRVPGDTSISFSRWSPKIGMTVDVTHDLNVYASFRQGFRAPAQGQLFQQGSNLNTVGLKPVTASSAEVGLRGSLTRRVSFQLALYDMRVKNDILSVLDTQGITTSSNAGETRHRGLELGTGIALASSLRLDAAYSSSSQRYVTWVIPVGSSNKSYAGNTLEQAPHTLANLLLTWHPRSFHGGRLAAEWSSTGRYFMDAENTHAYGGFELWTLHGNYVVRGLGEVFARVTNLTNRRYAELVSYTAFNKEQFTPGNPRMVYAGLRWAWQS
ncbi:MAG: TonB-dependent receptor [Gemmatimonadota bacterium]